MGEDESRTFNERARSMGRVSEPGPVGTHSLDDEERLVPGRNGQVLEAFNCECHIF